MALGMSPPLRVSPGVVLPPAPPRHATEPKDASAWDEAEEPIGSKVSLEEKRYREFQAFQWRERALISTA